MASIRYRKSSNIVINASLTDDTWSDNAYYGVAINPVFLGSNDLSIPKYWMSSVNEVRDATQAEIDDDQLAIVSDQNKRDRREAKNILNGKDGNAKIQKARDRFFLREVNKINKRLDSLDGKTTAKVRRADLKTFVIDALDTGAAD